MKFSVPRNILYMIVVTMLLDIINQIQVLTFSTLAEVVGEMNNHTLVNHFGLEPTKASISLMNSIMTTTNDAGNALGILFLVPIADTRGRKYVAAYIRFAITFATAICQLLATIFQASEVYLLGQLILGSHYCLRTFVSPIYILECAPDNCRGFASTVLIFSFVFAKLIMFSVASPNVLGTSSLWFIFPLFAMISSVAVLCLTVRLPESPKWLVQQNRIREAKEAIQFYHGQNYNLHEVLTSAIKEKSLTEEKKLTLRQVWENETLREALKILLAVLIFLEFDTSYVISTYTLLLHKTAGFSVIAAMNINLIVTIILLPTKFMGTFILDAFGRRPTMLIAGTMHVTKSVLMLLDETIIYFSSSSLLTEIIYVVVESLAAIVPATGVHSIRVLFVSELFPPAAKTAVGQAMLFTSMAIGTPILSIFPIINSIFPPVFFIPFVISQVILGIYLFRHLPETKGRAVYDIIESFDREVGSRSASIFDEKSPLIRDRARTLAAKRNSILNTPRTRALTFDHKFILPKN
ncbi:unnamed protein product [Caenorhabditis brenneri]